MQCFAVHLLMYLPKLHFNSNCFHAVRIAYVWVRISAELFEPQICLCFSFHLNWMRFYCIYMFFCCSCCAAWCFSFQFFFFSEVFARPSVFSCDISWGFEYIKYAIQNQVLALKEQVHVVETEMTARVKSFKLKCLL